MVKKVVWVLGHKVLITGNPDAVEALAGADIVDWEGQTEPVPSYMQEDKTEWSGCCC